MLQLTKYCTACQIGPSFRGHRMPSTISYSLILRTVTRDCTIRLLQLTKYCTACQIGPSFRGHRMPSTILYSLILRTVTRDCTTRLLQLTKYCTACQVRPSFRGHCMPSTISYITRTAHSHSYCHVMARANFHNLVMMDGYGG